jgi:hypothetical protein
MRSETAPMPSYRFNFVGPDTETVVVAHLPDDEAAERQGLETVAQLDFERWVKGGDPSEIAIEILDERGRFIATVNPATLTYECYKGRRQDKSGKK